MAGWRTFDVQDPPQGWCLVEMLSTDREGNLLAVLARWSVNGYAWIDVNLASIPGSHVDVQRYLELPYENLNHLLTGSTR